MIGIFMIWCGGVASEFSRWVLACECGPQVSKNSPPSSTPLKWGTFIPSVKVSIMVL